MIIALCWIGLILTMIASLWLFTEICWHTFLLVFMVFDNCLQERNFRKLRDNKGDIGYGEPNEQG